MELGKDLGRIWQEPAENSRNLKELEHTSSTPGTWLKPGGADRSAHSAGLILWRCGIDWLLGRSVDGLVGRCDELLGRSVDGLVGHGVTLGSQNGHLLESWGALGGHFGHPGGHFGHPGGHFRHPENHVGHQSRNCQSVSGAQGTLFEFLGSQGADFNFLTPQKGVTFLRFALLFGILFCDGFREAFLKGF